MLDFSSELAQLVVKEDFVYFLKFKCIYCESSAKIQQDHI